MPGRMPPSSSPGAQQQGDGADDGSVDLTREAVVGEGVQDARHAVLDPPVVRQYADKARRTLTWQPRPAAEAITDCARSLAAHQVP